LLFLPCAAVREREELAAAEIACCSGLNFWVSGLALWMSALVFWVSGLVFWVSGLFFWVYTPPPQQELVGREHTAEEDSGSD